VKRTVGIALAILAAALLFLAWAASSEALIAPRPLRQLWDAANRLIGRPDPHTACFTKKIEQGATVFAFAGPRDCYHFGPPRVFSGIYIDEFEGQSFLEGQHPPGPYRDQSVWISFDEKSDKSVAPLLHSMTPTRIWRIRFVGRKTDRAGTYGHLGMSNSEVLVDRVLEARLLGAYQGYLPPSVLIRSD
jgi:hypothetical protein